MRGDRKLVPKVHTNIQNTISKFLLYCKKLQFPSTHITKYFPNGLTLQGIRNSSSKGLGNILMHISVNTHALFSELLHFLTLICMCDTLKNVPRDTHCLYMYYRQHLYYVCGSTPSVNLEFTKPLR